MALTLDPVTMNTELAEEYLEKYNNFDTWPASKKYWRVKNYPHERDEFNVNESFVPYVKKSIPPYTARKLVAKIKEHESTFYQLEYLIRKTDKADFQSQLLLMCQHLQCDDCWNGQVDEINIFMTEKTPLYVLGCATAAKPRDVNLSIITTQRIAPICHLFSDLCTEVGWTINLIFVNDVNDYKGNIDILSSNIFEENAACFGITGVVTESADIDSALDVFINASVAAPWKLERVYVQESVYDEVKESLAARCGREAAPACGDAFPARGKLLVCEAQGAGEAARVPLEAYRTPRELTALLRAPLALSLWAADMPQAHELALAARAPIVWINEYAFFHGPPASSLPLYRSLYPDTHHSINEATHRNLEKCWTDWIKLTKNERIDLIMNTLQGMSSAPQGYDSVGGFQDAILNARDESFVSVDGGKICLCVERPPHCEDFINPCVNPKILDSIIATINGNAVVYNDIFTDSTTIDLLKLLEKAGVPLACDNKEKPVKHLKKYIVSKNLKVIRSNFGTIFAN